MSLGLDTSVVLRLLTGEPADHAQAAVDRLERAARAGESVLVSNLVVLESYHALQHHFGMPRNDASALLVSFLSSPVARPESADTLLALRAGGGAGAMDRLILRDYAAKGAHTLTFDAKLSRLPGAERIRPSRRT